LDLEAPLQRMPSAKLIIANHPMGFSRSGIPAHLQPWKSVWASSGNDIEVNSSGTSRSARATGENWPTATPRTYST